ncbi:DNA mismatch repair endonuclease MutL [Salibacter halophilus]|uniref:DNA mismatch repair protein MutL n=1 Tax=Salibacter halophilus TaxID=1803916 RepID=A0A6N6M4C8_9FLAO|nr:DNA mismatch repair endonuclease MutL [Salibacter halophilus]KAB1064319.1 DNA mismatch repair endonuclease MutL [Salibacter halophilus]
MANIVQLLPDNIANQIAAGEVIQRPASVVKELLENAVDADATEIDLIVKDAGKTLIRVIDNGSGMSDEDARMALERHATSKIRSSDDLFSIKTMGFRGEALASIASISHVEIKTKERSNDLGSQVLVEGSEVKKQEPTQTKNGTSIAVKNLFYNVPARRKFLKSDQVELRHIIDEFERVALPNPHIKFTFHHNDNELFHLDPGSFRQRVVAVFGKKFRERLVPVEQKTNILDLRGFVGKPESARKTRGEQFFFVNGRFIKSHYLHHAISEAMEELIPKGYHPSYFIELQVEPDFIDVNIHPTKTEIKFEDERAIYAIVSSSVRQAIGQYNITPTIDFEQETSFDGPSSNKPVTPPQIKVDTSYNPFEENKQFGGKPGSDRKKFSGSEASKAMQRENYEKLFRANPEMAKWTAQHLDQEDETPEETQQQSFEVEEKEQHKMPCIQLHKKYILSTIKSGAVLIHQSRAHERILFERFTEFLANNPASSQQSLFPQQVQFSAQDATLVEELSDELKMLGFELSGFGKTTFVVQGMPDYAVNQDPQELLETVLENYKNNLQELKLDKQEAFARSLAQRTAIIGGKELSRDEMLVLIEELFACSNPYTTPGGRPIIHTFTIKEFDKLFN